MAITKPNDKDKDQASGPAETQAAVVVEVPAGLSSKARQVDMTPEKAKEYQDKGKLAGYDETKGRGWIIPAILLAFSLLFGGQAVAAEARAATDTATMGNEQWYVQTDGDIIPSSDSTYDLGATGNEIAAIYADTATIGAMTLTTWTGANAETIANPVDDTVRVASNDEHTTLQVYGFEAKDAILALTADEGDDNADKFSFKMSAAGALTLEVNAVAFATFTTSTGALAMTGDLSGDGGDQLFGFLQDQVATTTTSVTAAQAGKSFVSDSADVMTLPEASTVLGARYTFICGTADDLDINPADASDQIGVVVAVAGTITPAAGDAIRITDVGASVTLEAVGANAWAVVAFNGAVTDVN